MARIVRFHEVGGPEVLKLEEVVVPPPQADEVQIAVRAIGLNRAESMFRTGFYIEDPVFPARLGYEAAGVVEAVGADAGAFRPGDAVSVIPPCSITKWGTYGELINVRSDLVVKHAADLGFTDAAAIWMANLTAYGALVHLAGTRTGDHVLINAASSSVGIAAIQITNMLGAVPIALTRTSAKASELLAAGAAHVVATQEEDLVNRVNDITGGIGARIAFDPVAGPDLARLTASMSRFGILVVYGMLSPEPTPLPLFDLMPKSLTVKGFYHTDFLADLAARDGLKEFVAHGIASGALTPVIARIFPLEEIAEATRFLESNQQIGKVVVTV